MKMRGLYARDFLFALKLLRLLKVRGVSATTFGDAQLVAAARDGFTALVPPNTNSNGNWNSGRHGVAS